MPVIVVEEHCPVTRASRSTSGIFDAMCAHKATSTIGARALLAFTFQPVCGCATRFQRAPKGPRTKVPLEAACLCGTGLGPSIRPMEFIGSDWMDLLVRFLPNVAARTEPGTVPAPHVPSSLMRTRQSANNGSVLSKIISVTFAMSVTLAADASLDI